MRNALTSLDNKNILYEDLLIAQHDVLELIAKNSPLQETLSYIANFSEKWIPGMRGSILVYDPNEGKLKRGGYGSMPVAFVDIVDGLVPGPKMGSCGTCAYLKRRVVSEDVFSDELWEGFHDLCRQFNINSAWSSPLLSARDGGLLGVFGMYHPEQRPLQNRDVVLVDHFARLAALSIERHNDQKVLEYRATHDQLTGLGNRRLLEEKGQEFVTEGLDAGKPVSLVFIDLDNFKAINDTFGHLQGDKLLCEVSKSIKSFVGENSLLVRLGGDEFVAVILSDLDEVASKLTMLRASLDSSVNMGDTRVQIRFSAGVVDCSLKGMPDELEALIGYADEMVRSCKSLGGDRFIVADHSISKMRLSRSKIARDLTLVLRDPDSIWPHVQPIFKLDKPELSGFEMLMRIRDRRLEKISPAECIEVAERTGLINEIGNRMLKKGFDFAANNADMFDGMTMNVNVSVRQLMGREFIEYVSVLSEINPQAISSICIEVTESQYLDPSSPAGNVLNLLKSMGFKLSLDDFGMGHASLSYLQSLPFDSVKVDRFFVKDIEEVPRNRAICQALIAMATSCDMKVVAEGVETGKQAEILLDLGCKYAQGYLWSKPFPVEQAPGYILKYKQAF